MKNVHQHPDGNIFVRVDSVVYMDTPDNFARDFAVTFPALPDGYNERIYEQGRRHLVSGETDAGAHILGQDMPWPLGDEIIEKIGAAMVTQKARQTTEAAAKPAPVK